MGVYRSKQLQTGKQDTALIMGTGYQYTVLAYHVPHVSDNNGSICGILPFPQRCSASYESPGNTPSQHPVHLASAVQGASRDYIHTHPLACSTKLILPKLSTQCLPRRQKCGGPLLCGCPHSAGCQIVHPTTQRNRGTGQASETTCSAPPHDQEL
jgi:hypothetical protein